MKIYEDQKFTCLEQKVNDKTVPPQTSLGSKYVYNFNEQRGSNRGFKIFCFSIFFRDRQIKVYVRCLIRNLWQSYLFKWNKTERNEGKSNDL